MKEKDKTISNNKSADTDSAEQMEERPKQTQMRDRWGVIYRYVVAR